MQERLPQRFRYRRMLSDPWVFGVCMPRQDFWQIYADQGHGSFHDDPWETLGHIIGDVACFEWIDHDFEWSE